MPIDGDKEREDEVTGPPARQRWSGGWLLPLRLRIAVMLPTAMVLGVILHLVAPSFEALAALAAIIVGKVFEDRWLGRHSDELNAS